MCRHKTLPLFSPNLICRSSPTRPAARVWYRRNIYGFAVTAGALDDILWLQDPGRLLILFAGPSKALHFLTFPFAERQLRQLSFPRFLDAAVFCGVADFTLCRPKFCGRFPLLFSWEAPWDFAMTPLATPIRSFNDGSLIGPLGTT